MVSNKRGLVVNVSSLGAIIPVPLEGIYSASKIYVDYFSSSLRYEYKDSNINVLNLRPWFISTKMWHWSDRLSNPSPLESLLVPTANQFVASAITTFGRTNETTGYWGHALVSFIANDVAPRSILRLFSTWMLKQLNSQKLK
ncbi:short chain dehydrogenase-like protein [Leptotrombidium deliense]|uniref:Short chain dehydrogenase-like protein n=1 Tax=Leptotrombidium deliense TaxID=299467 RepID=A0A443RSM9_9ACAR|nr:short chain dehydrogenase-like protein [Leptotrombidium deliense]